jgi:hypothetical protein
MVRTRNSKWFALISEAIAAALAAARRAAHPERWLLPLLSAFRWYL